MLRIPPGEIRRGRGRRCRGRLVASGGEKRGEEEKGCRGGGASGRLSSGAESIRPLFDNGGASAGRGAPVHERPGLGSSNGGSGGPSNAPSSTSSSIGRTVPAHQDDRAWPPGPPPSLPPPADTRRVRSRPRRSPRDAGRCPGGWSVPGTGPRPRPGGGGDAAADRGSGGDGEDRRFRIVTVRGGSRRAPASRPGRGTGHPPGCRPGRPSTDAGSTDPNRRRRARFSVHWAAATSDRRARVSRQNRRSASSSSKRPRSRSPAARARRMRRSARMVRMPRRPAVRPGADPRPTRSFEDGADGRGVRRVRATGSPGRANSTARRPASAVARRCCRPLGRRSDQRSWGISCSARSSFPKRRNRCFTSRIGISGSDRPWAPFENCATRPS